MRKNFGTKSWFYPLPVLIVGTYGEDGRADAMNAAWGGLYDADKVVLCLSAGHKTTANIKKRGAFTVSFADKANLAASDYVGIVSANTEPKKWKNPDSTPRRASLWTLPSSTSCPLRWSAGF